MRRYVFVCQIYINEYFPRFYNSHSIFSEIQKKMYVRSTFK